MPFIHKELASGRWQRLSYIEQLANIGSEVTRASRWKDKDKKLFWPAVERAQELFLLTLADHKWSGPRLRELSRLYEIFCDAVLGGTEYNSSLKDLEKYFFYFALLSRRKAYSK